MDILSVSVRVLAVLERLVSERAGGSFFWEEVVSAVRAEKIPVKNWLLVRRILAGSFLAPGRFVRVDDIFRETYRVN